MHRLVTVTVLAVALMFGIRTPPASGQSNAAVELLEFPSWLGATDVLRFGLRITNRGDEVASNIRVSINFHEGVDTRSQLERGFVGRFGSVVGGDTLAVPTEVPPRESRDVFVEKPLQEISFFRNVPADRAYPVRITVRAGRDALAPIDTFMIFVATPAIEPLELALVIPLYHPPTYSPDLVMNSQIDGFLESLEEGRIATILNVLENHPDVPITIAPTGLFLDTLQDIAGGYEIERGGSKRSVSRNDPSASAATTAITRMKSLISRPLTRVITSPYSTALLPVLGQRFAAFRVTAQIGATTKLIEQVIEAQPLGRWVLPLPEELDEPSLSVLQSGGLVNGLVSSESVRLEPSSLTRPAPARVATRSGEAGLLITDPGLSQRLAETHLNAVEARQRFLAETLTIYLERPAQKRMVAVVAPTEWDPEEVTLTGIIRALLQSPWVRGVGPDQATSALAQAPKVELASSSSFQDRFDLPPSNYFSQLQAARRAVDDFSEISPPQEVMMALEKRILIAEGSGWWTSRRRTETGREFATEVTRVVSREFSKVKGPSPLTITLTSRTGIIPISITSGADYPMDVVVRLESTQLRFPDAATCPNSATGSCISIKKLQPRAQTIEVNTIAEGTGTFPVNVIIQTPRSSVRLASTLLSVRSTAYNVVGAGITMGAGAFLGAWFLASILRRRKSE